MIKDELKVSIIIPVLYLKRPKNLRYFYSMRYTLKELLRDIQDNVSISHETIVVCNSQDDELVSFIKTHPAIDKYCLNSSNAGVARSWNMGAQLAEGQTVCFINDDVQVGKKTIEKLYDVLMNSEKAGMVGPKGARWKGAGHERYVGENAIEEADAISGFMFMIKRCIYNELGGFDVAYTPAGFEEIDMSFMVTRAGYKCYVVPYLDVRHCHEHGVSAANVEIHYFGHSISTKELHARNKEYFQKKWEIHGD